MEIKKRFKQATLGGLTALVLATSGCGDWEKTKEQSFHYQSLTGKSGHVTLYSDEKIVADYEHAKIVYSASDSRALWLEVDGKQIYWQGNALVELDK